MESQDFFTLPAYSTLFLIFMWIWGRIDGYIASYYAAKYKPFMPAANPRYKPQKDVSNNPLEIIIATTAAHENQVRDLLNQIISTRKLDTSKFRIVATDQQGKRIQTSKGFTACRGQLIACADDHIFWTPEYLTYMLACFEDPLVGAAAPQILPYLPSSRRGASVVTPWEVAVMKLIRRFGAGGWTTAMWAAKRWCFVLGGYAGVYRADILQHPDFIEAFNSDSWRGAKLDVGEDTFISRWIPKQGFTIATQWCDEARAWRTLKRTSAFIPQILRWEKSSMQTFLRSLYEIPGFWRLSNWLIIYKTFERLVKGPLIPTHLIAWILSFYSHWLITSALLVIYMRQILPGYCMFFNEYPYMIRYWWVAVLVDHFAYGVIGPWAYLTLSDTTWKRFEE